MLRPYLLAACALLVAGCGPADGVPANGGFFGPPLEAIYVLDFGEVPVGEAATLHTVVRATSRAVLVSPPEMEAPFSSDLHAIERIEAGDERRVEFSFQPTATGRSQQEVMLRTNGTTATYRLSGLGVPGETVCKPEPRTDLFTNVRPRVDVLVVIDDHASMDAIREKLVEDMRALPAWLDEDGVDWRLAVTTSGVGGGCLGGQLLGEKVLSRDSVDAADQLEAMLRTPVCNGSGRGLQASVSAVEEAGGAFARPEAGLKLIVVSTRDDKSPDAVVSYGRAHLLARGGDTERVRMLALVGEDGGHCAGTEPGARYADAVSFLNGARRSLCDDAWGITSFFEPASDFGMPVTYRLGTTPADDDGDGQLEDDLEVRLDGDVVVSSEEGGAGNWYYDAAANAVIFHARPLPGQNVEIGYRSSCES